QDALVLRRRGARVGEADVGAEGDALAVWVEVVTWVFELVGAAEPRAGDAVAPDHVGLLEHPDPVPELDVHADRADHLEGAAVGPGGFAGARGHPDELVHQLGVGGVRVGGAVAEAEEVAGAAARRRPAFGALEAVDPPARGEDAGRWPEPLPRL